MNATATKEVSTGVLEQEQQGRPIIAMPAGSTSLLAAITRAASDPSVDMDKMERLFGMHLKIVAIEAEAAFNDAMAKAQSNMQPIVRDAKNDHTRSTYATLAQINRDIVPIYSAEGMSVSYDTETRNADDPITEGFLRIVAMVSHSRGHSRRYHIDLPSDNAGAQGKINKTGVQAAGSTNSYGRRFLTMMIFNLSTEDDDGNVDQKREEQKEPVNETPKTYPDEGVKTNLPKWRQLIEDGIKTPDQIIDMVNSKAVMTDEQKAILRAIKPKPLEKGAPEVTFELLHKRITEATDIDMLDADGALVRLVQEDKRTELQATYIAKRRELEGVAA